MARKSRKHLQDAQYNTSPPAPTTPNYVAGVYARISSEDHPSDSIENQIDITEAFLSKHSNIELHKIYMDSGVSSFAAMRPGFEDMLLDIQSKTINCVIVKDISRFSREYLEAGDLLQRKFPVWGTRFISITDGFDSLYSDASGLQMVLKSVLAYEYSKDLSRKIHSVIDMRQITGIYTPPKLPYGFIKGSIDSDSMWQVDKAKAQIVKEIFDLAAKGASAYSIAHQLNSEHVSSPNGCSWSPKGILRILQDETYIGTFITGKTRTQITDSYKTVRIAPENWMRHKQHHAPIVNEFIFYKVQTELEKRSRHIAKTTTPEDFFGGKLYCGSCGRKMKRKMAANGSMYYICPKRDESNTCPNKACNAEKLKSLVYQQISKKISEALAYRDKMLAFERTPYFLNQEKERLLRLNNLKEKLNEQMKMFKTAIENIAIDHRNGAYDANQLLRYMTAVRDNIREEISVIEAAMEAYWQNESSHAEWLQPFLRFENDDALTREMLHNLIARIIMRESGVEVILV